METHFPSASSTILGVVAALRDLVLSAFPDAVETHDSENLGYGFSARYRDTVFVISPHRNHVTFGFAYGVDLPDPARLLEGTGKRHRHVKVRSQADAQSPQLAGLVTRAVSAARAR